MIREKTIARVFAAVLLIGMFCVGYVILTQPTGMITYQTYSEPEELPEKAMSEEEVIHIFETEWEDVKDKLVMLGETE